MTAQGQGGAQSGICAVDGEYEDKIPCGGRCHPGCQTAPAASPADEGQAGEAEALAETLGRWRKAHAERGTYGVAASARILTLLDLLDTYVSAAEVERLVTEARVKALRDAANEVTQLCDCRADDPACEFWTLANRLRVRADSHDTGSERGQS